MHRSKSALLGSVAIIAALSAWSTTAHAQAAAPKAAAAEEAVPTGAAEGVEVGEVTVTGSRVIRDGTSSPTPLEVVGVEEIQKSGSGNVTALLSTLPAFAGNQQPQSAGATANASAALIGLNLVNLRGLGTNRTLVLVDGQRFIPTLTIGNASIYGVDISGIPQQAISRVETVTGGASAVYGSDAVGGAVNFILDRKFVGFKADVSGQVTTYGDDKGSRIDATWGKRFMGDKAHILLSGQLTQKDDLFVSNNRAWDFKNFCTMTNPNFTATNGQPARLLVDNCGENSAPGGVINTGVLRGTTFGPGGVPLPFVYGPLVSTPLMSGGSWELAAATRHYRGISLDPEDRRQNIFGLFTYDFTEKTKLTLMGSVGHAYSYQHDNLQFTDSSTGVQIQTNNAFIPSSLRPALVGQPAFTLSTLNGDLKNIESSTSRFVYRYSAQLDGSFHLFNDWTWNAYYQYGRTRNILTVYSMSRARYLKATKAVFDSTGKIVCADNIDSDLTNDDAACVPYNLFGLGVNSQAAIDYVSNYGQVHQQNNQKVLAGSITGQPFSLWAGPIGVALSGEHRVESAKGVSNQQALTNDQYSGNYKPVTGEVTVNEAALEITVPLLKDSFLGKALDLQLAGRATNYSTSGNVQTWKVGATYQPIDQLLFRANISHDIRAGNIGELFAFAGAPVVTPIALDPFTNLSGTIARVSSKGNPSLLPEEADSYGFGAVWKPSFLPGFSASIDYWKVDVSGLISALTATQALNLCYNGNPQACAFITRLSGPLSPGVGTYAGQSFGPINTIETSYVNIASNTTSGLDQYVAYRFPLNAIYKDAPGNVSLRLDGTYYYKGFNDPGIPGSFPTYQTAFWRGVLSADYSNDKWSFGIRGRYISKGASQPNLAQIILCTTTCPAQASIPNTFTTQNYLFLKSSNFIDVNATRNLTWGDRQVQLYVNIRNVMDREPLLSPGTQPFSIHLSSGDDALGRMYRFGVRIRM